MKKEDTNLNGDVIRRPIFWIIFTIFILFIILFTSLSNSQSCYENGCEGQYSRERCNRNAQSRVDLSYFLRNTVLDDIIHDRELNIDDEYAELEKLEEEFDTYCKRFGE